MFRKRFLNTFYKFLFSAFFYVLFTNNISAQHEKLIDSLDALTSFERRRVVSGYMESRADLLNKSNNDIVFLKQIKEFATQKKDYELVNEIKRIQKLKDLISGHSADKKIDILIEITENYDKTDDLLFLGYCYHELGQKQFQNEKYAQAFESDIKALKVFQKIGYSNVPKIGKVLHEVALHYYFFENYNEVIKLMRTSLELPPFSRGLDMQRYNNIGLAYMKTEKNDSAKYFLNKGILVSKKYKANIWIGLLSDNLANIYFKEKKYDSVYHYSKKNYEYNNDEKIHSTVKTKSYISMGKIYLQLDSIEKANEFIRLSDNMLSLLSIKHIGDKQQIESTKNLFFELKRDYLIKTKDFRTALQYQDSLMKINYKLKEKYNIAVTKMSSNKLLIQDKELQIAQKEQEKTNQKLIYIGLIFLVSIAGGICYFYMYINKKRKKRQNEQLITSTRISILEKQKTQKELEFAQKEINHFISKINEQNTIVSKFEEDLKKLKELEFEKRKQVEETLNLLKNTKILTDEDWISFQDNFNTVFINFKPVLKKEFPSITTSELRYLMLIKLNFSHKEMARALGVSGAAIRVTWNRVRKKLNGTLEDTPTELLNKILNT